MTVPRMISKWINKLTLNPWFTYQTRKHLQESSDAEINIGTLSREMWKINEPGWNNRLCSVANSQTENQQDQNNQWETLIIMCKAVNNNNACHIPPADVVRNKKCGWKHNQYNSHSLSVEIGHQNGHCSAKSNGFSKSTLTACRDWTPKQMSLRKIKQIWWHKINTHFL